MEPGRIAKIIARFAELSDRDLRRSFRRTCRVFADYVEHMDMDMAEVTMQFIDGILDEWNRRHPE